MKRLLIAFAVLVALVATPAIAGRVLENEDNALDGVFKVKTAKNKTKDEVYKDIAIDIEGKYADLRLSDNLKVRLKADQFYDWGFCMELTAHDRETKDMWIVKYEGNARTPGGKGGP